MSTVLDPSTAATPETAPPAGRKLPRRKAKDDTETLNRELELRVRDRTARLLEADQRKDEFLATLAHELRNPLAPIRFALDALKSESSPANTAHARDVIPWSG